MLGLKINREWIDDLRDREVKLEIGNIVLGVDLDGQVVNPLFPGALEVHLEFQTVQNIPRGLASLRDVVREICHAQNLTLIALEEGKENIPFHRVRVDIDLVYQT